MFWRIVGSENGLMWMGLYPDEVQRFVDRINEFSLELMRAQIKAADGRLDGFVIWGDVAYKKGMLFSPVFWRQRCPRCHLILTVSALSFTTIIIKS